MEVIKLYNADDNGYYHYYLNKLNGDVLVVYGCDCTAEAENTVCRHYYNEDWCIKYLGVFRELYVSKNPTLEMERVYKKWQPTVRRFLKR